MRLITSHENEEERGKKLTSDCFQIPGITYSKDLEIRHPKFICPS